LNTLISKYIPLENVAECKIRMFDTLVKLLNKSGLEETIKAPVVD